MSDKDASNLLNENVSENTSTADLAKVLESIVSSNHETMLAFNEAMGRREELSIRIGKRTTQILRFGIMSILLISGLMFFLIQSLSKHIDTMAGNITQISTTMDNMDRSFTVVTQQLQSVNTTMGGLNDYIATMSQDIHSVPQMTVTMSKLQQSIDVMSQSINTMNGDMHALNYSTSGINQQFSTLIKQMGVMSYDVNQMSRPMKYFPFPD